MITPSLSKNQIKLCEEKCMRGMVFIPFFWKISLCNDYHYIIDAIILMWIECMIEILFIKKSSRKVLREIKVKIFQSKSFSLIDILIEVNFLLLYFLQNIYDMLCEHHFDNSFNITRQKLFIFFWQLSVSLWQTHNWSRTNNV